MYEEAWHLSPLPTTVVFAVYAVAALGAVLVSGRISDAGTVAIACLIAAVVGAISTRAPQAADVTR